MTFDEKYEIYDELKKVIYDIISNNQDFFGTTFKIPLGIDCSIPKDYKEEIFSELKYEMEFIDSLNIRNKEFSITFKNYSYENILGLIEQYSHFNEKLLPLNHIEDEEQSVRWNREYVEKFNENVKNRKLKHSKFINSLEESYVNKLINDNIEYKNVFKDIPKEVFKIIYRKAYEDGHSYGYNEVRNYFYEELSMFEDILIEMNKNKNIED